MTADALEQFFSDALAGGRYRARELRLTDEQARYFLSHYPGASLLPMEDGWYRVILKEAN